MKIWKILTFLLFIVFVFCFLPTNIFAQNEFTVDSTVSYNVQDSGSTQVVHNINLVNNFSTLYATTYTLSLENIDATNVKANDDKGQNLKTDVSSTSGKTDIKITFPDAVVGKGANRHFFVTYGNSSFAVRTGEVWEVSIPKLSSADAFRSYTVDLNIPSSFGLEAYISPKPQSSTQGSGGLKYVFNKDQILSAGITAGFGQFQVFSFNLAYHLENPLAVSSSTEVALPPDTAFQKVYYSKIDPKPTNVKIDEDGNWIATYSLKPRQRIDVVATGAVQIFASYRSFPKPSDSVLSDNLKETQYWQVNDPKIRNLATQLKTPQAIYDYVSTYLKYDFARVQPNVSRMGASAALDNPTQAICMEYTDLFVAIARAAGIPAREINGFAYTENPQLQPLSLVADVLHSWPEYYDKNKGAWIPVDPTWGSTTGGVDYFNKLDLRHFAFVIHGQDSIKPYPPGSYKLGPNPQKDVYVAFGQLPEQRISKLMLSASVARNIPFLDLIYKVILQNPGPEALYSLYPSVNFDSKEASRNFIQVMPPFSNYAFDVSVPFSILGKDTPQYVNINVDGSSLSISTNKNQVIINSALVLFAAFFVIMIFILIRLKKITFRRLTATIQAIYGKISGKTKKDTNNS